MTAPILVVGGNGTLGRNLVPLHPLLGPKAPAVTVDLGRVTFRLPVER